MSETPSTQPETDSRQLPIEVGLGKWAKTEEGRSTIETKGLGPCIGFAAYDPGTKTGYMMHISPAKNEVLLDDAMRGLLQESPDPHMVKVWIRGGQPNPNEAGNLIKM